MQRGGNRENAGDDWQVGDWAECILTGFVPPRNSDPKVGERLIVCDVFTGPLAVQPAVITVGLRFIGKEKCLSWQAVAFRKIISDREEPKRLARVPEPVA